MGILMLPIVVVCSIGIMVFYAVSSFLIGGWLGITWGILSILVILVIIFVAVNVV